MPAAEFVDLYEVLQVSPKAEKDTIKRVHQILSLKYQLAAPENNAVAYFSELQKAAATLLDNEARTKYDAERSAWLAKSAPTVCTDALADAPTPAPVAPPQVLEAPVPAEAAGPVPAAVPQAPVHTGKLDPRRFMEGLNVAEEKRRRAGLMEICYRQRILKPRTPALSVKQLEDGLELTVTELEGSLWYLKETDLIRVSDAGNFALSVKGINAIEGGFVNFAEGIFDMKSFGL